MNYTPSKRDLDVAIGMFSAYRMISDARDEGLTPIDALKEYGSIPEDYITMLYEIAEHHATVLQSAVLDAAREFPEKVEKLSVRDREFAAKQAFVMSALVEGVLAQDGRDFTDLDLHGEPYGDDAVRRASDGLDPAMVGYVAELIVKGGFPEEHPVNEILVALWIEGFIVGIMSGLMLEMKSSDPKIRHIYEVAEKTFGGKYT